MNGSRWQYVCALEDICPDAGVCALLDGRQIAVFRVRDVLYAISNCDPVCNANVLSRGIVGDLGGDLVVASPMYKHHFCLSTGRCLENPSLSVEVYPVRMSEGQVWLRTQPIPQRIGPRRLVIVGNGPAAMHTLEQLLELAPREYAVTVFGGESSHTYNRVMLSAVLSGERSTEHVVSHTPEWFAEREIALHSADPVIRIDRIRRRVQSLSGIDVPYDRLLIATGSLPKSLAVPGHDLPGVMAVRELRDVEAILAAARTTCSAVVIGGGVLGLETANALRRVGTPVTVVQDQALLMNRQLDAAAATLMRQQLEESDIRFHLSAQTVALRGNSAGVSTVVLADGQELAADLVVVAIGVMPNIELARPAGLRCEQGILVDDTMLSYDPSVYAVGECVQHRGSTYGVVAPLLDQARVCAAHLAERGVCRYRGSGLSTQLRIGNIEIFTAGDSAAGAGAESLVLRDPARRVYRRLVIENDRVRGALLYGDTRDGTWYLDLIKAARPIGAMRDRLMFGQAAGERMDLVE
jgi:nitrite reductase (NADH) large subunit